MTTFHAHMMDAGTGAEGRYQFDGPTDLMKATADEIVTLFFEHAQHDVPARASIGSPRGF
jgi:hypothetical protein